MNRRRYFCPVGVFNRSVTTIHSRSLLSSFLVSTVYSSAVKNFTSLLTLAFPAVKFHNSFVIAIDRTLLLLTFLAYCSARKWVQLSASDLPIFFRLPFHIRMGISPLCSYLLSSLEFSLWPGRSESWRCTCASLTG